jgi:hypothetical protein
MYGNAGPRAIVAGIRRRADRAVAANNRHAVTGSCSEQNELPRGGRDDRHQWIAELNGTDSNARNARKRRIVSNPGEIPQPDRRKSGRRNGWRGHGAARALQTGWGDGFLVNGAQNPSGDAGARIGFVAFTSKIPLKIRYATVNRISHSVRHEGCDSGNPSERFRHDRRTDAIDF